MPGFHLNEMGDLILDSVDDISVVDVYDVASDIGKECEKIIDHYGTDSVAGLMPKVINALELLEALAVKNERENAIVQELNDRIAQLENEKIEKAEFRKRFEKEIESIEEQWKTDTKELVDLVSSLQEENRRIIKQQQEQLQSQSSGLGSSMTESFMSITNYEISNSLSDTQILQRLKTQILKQRDEIKSKDRELQEKIADIDNLTIQIERLKNTTSDTRRRQKLLQAQIRTLCEERADFLAQLQDQHREIFALRRRLGIAEKENEDLIKSQDENDPNRPRYTTLELKDLLNERDELLTKIDDLTEELNCLKPPNTEEDSSNNQNEILEDDPPVQGPLPCEPDDAPWKKCSESGIRKFFRKLFAENDGSSFPRRSLSSLSKITLSTTNNSNNISSL